MKPANKLTIYRVVSVIFTMALIVLFWSVIPDTWNQWLSVLVGSAAAAFSFWLGYIFFKVLKKVGE